MSKSKLEQFVIGFEDTPSWLEYKQSIKRLIRRK